MLYLTRKAGESILINDQVKMTVIDIKGKSVRIGFLFSPGVRVLREEIFVRMQKEDQEIAQAGKCIAELERLEALKKNQKKKMFKESIDSPDDQTTTPTDEMQQFEIELPTHSSLKS